MVKHIQKIRRLFVGLTVKGLKALQFRLNPLVLEVH